MAYHLGMQKPVRTALLEVLAGLGQRAVAPADSNWFEILDTPEGKASNWSERHAAYAAGLGSFGMNRAFISTAGSSIVLSSIVTDVVITPDERAVSGHQANCLRSSGIECTACIRRCPAGALSEHGHDKARCAVYGYGPDSRKLAASYGLEGPAGCALCQTGVPCEAVNPSHGSQRR